MKLRVFPFLLLALALVSCTGCVKKVDPKRPVEKIQAEAAFMSVAQLESYATAYAAEIRAQKAEIAKIQQQIKKIPVEKFFDNKTMTREVAAIGRRAEALFERYRIYVNAFQEKGGDLSKVQIEPSQS